MNRKPPQGGEAGRLTGHGRPPFLFQHTMKTENNDFWRDLLLASLRGLSNGLTYAILAVALFTAAIFCSAATPPTLADITLPAGVTTNATFTGTGYGVFRLNVSSSDTTLRDSTVAVFSPSPSSNMIAINIQPYAKLVLDHTVISNDSGQNSMGVQGLSHDTALEVRNGSVITAGRGLSIAGNSRILIDASSVTATSAISLGAIYAFHDNIDLTILNGSTIRAGANDRAIYVDGGNANIRIADSRIEGFIAFGSSQIASSFSALNSTVTGQIASTGSNVVSVTNSDIGQTNSTSVLLTEGGSVTITNSTMHGNITQLAKSGNVTISKSTVAGLSATGSAAMTVRVTDGSVIQALTPQSSVNGRGLAASFENGSRLEGMALGVGKLSFDSTSRWELSANSQVGTLSLAGRINFPATPTTLMVDDLVGNGGTISISAALKGDETPISRIFITKSATGLTHLQIINAGGAGSLTKRGIKVVDYMSTAQPSSGTFDMPAGPVIVGPFSYALKQLQDGDYYLVSEVAPAARLPAVTLFAHQDWTQRAVGSYLEHPRSGVWTTGQASNTWNDTGDGLRTHVTTHALRAGSSLGSWQALDLGAIAGINDLSVAGAEGRIDLSSFEAVLTASSSHNWGFMEVSVGGQRLRHATHVLGNTLRSQGWNFLGAFEAGRSWHWKSICVTPSVQAIAQTGDLDATQGTTLRVRYGNANLVTIRGAVNVAYRPRSACLLWLSVGGTSRSDASTTAHLTYQGGEEFRVASAMAGLSALVESGIDLRLADRVHFYGFARYNCGPRSHGLAAGVGIRRDYR